MTITMYDIESKTNIDFFYHTINKHYSSINRQTLEILHPLYNILFILEWNNQLVISTIDKNSPDIHIDLNRPDWIEWVNKAIPYNMKDIINSYKKLEDRWHNSNWDDYSNEESTKKITHKAIYGALKLSNLIENSKLPLPKIYPHYSGGIVFKWKNCKIKVLAKGNIEFSYTFDDNETIDFIIITKENDILNLPLIMY